MPKSSYQWVRFRHKWASGVWGWEYTYLARKSLPYYEDLEEALLDHDLAEDHSWSDKYRGMDTELVPPSKVPQKVKEEFLQKYKNREAYSIEQQKYILRLMKVENILDKFN